MTMNNYTIIKNIFVEGNEVTNFISLDKSTLAYHRILNALQKPLKLILFYGKPGCGKTFLLNKIKIDLEKKTKVVFFPQPFFDEQEFFIELYSQIFGVQPSIQIESYETFMRIYKSKFSITQANISTIEPIVILLDEAQLYPGNLIEKIRLMADTRLFKFLFTVHKTDEEDRLAKEYFKTRIWESIELPNSTLSEVKLYIEKKLIFHGFHQYFFMFNDSIFELIFELTDGNLRNINKLLYKTYELLEYYEVNKPTEVSLSNISSRVVEMAAIGVGLLNA